MRCSDHLHVLNFTVKSTSKSIIDETYRRKENYSMKIFLNLTNEDAQSAFKSITNFILQSFMEVYNGL